ncbi:hypothetical protein BOTBODRAFT_52707 [Botryobasidium botryosum FD-172 SS1]|uniref:BTB domain-containing protein n=1 Tax=Botryobasidium botryosum (strain FD-172 SS1) TaxID=930990 RepID=A0A067MQN7_BOTB1|nr:hypothetical protein BOTBODRAFT_52707 [Botryobasidium botryosum FD-172 SS1]
MSDVSPSQIPSPAATDDTAALSHETEPLDPVIRDHRYYFHDGNIILLVEATLFKVHRSILAQDSSIFESTFTLPPPDLSQTASPSPEGTSDENPFILHGETPERFRLLLSALYGLPREIFHLFGPYGDFRQLVDIASIAHKYSFEDIEAWSASLLTKRLQRSQYPADFDFLPFLDYAIISSKDTLQNETLRILRALILEDKIDFIHIISHAEKRTHKSWRALLGLAFYHYIIKGAARWDLDRYRDRLPRSMGILLNTSFATLVDMRQSTIPWDHVCGDAAECESRWSRTLRDDTSPWYGDVQSYDEGYDDIQRNLPADFAGWVRRTISPGEWDDCQSIAASRHRKLANDLEAGSWEFFEKLQW